MRVPILADLNDEWQKVFDKGKKNKHLAIRATMEGVRAVPQGALLGLANYQFSKMMSNPEVAKKMSPEQLKAFQAQKDMPAWKGVVPLVGLFAAQSAAKEVMAHYRPKEDMWNSCDPPSARTL